MKTLASITLIISLLFFATSCNKPQNLQFKNIQNVKLNSLNKGVVKISAEAIFHNPNKVKADLSNIDLEVFIDENKVGNILQGDLASVPANADFTLPLTIDVPTKQIFKKGILGSALNALLGEDLKVAFNGSARVKILGIGFNIPIKHSENVKVKL